MHPIEEENDSFYETNSSAQYAKPNCCTVFGTLLKMCGLCCYIGCPPIPEAIARKLAFHPPKKGVSYTVHCVMNPEKKINEADEIIIFTQPNSSDLGSFLQPRFMNLPQFADIFEMDVYGFDYSGYGYSSGTVSEKNIYSDIRAIYAYVRQTRPDKQIVLLGYSIGTAAVVDLASSHPEGLAGVVLVAPFTSGLRLLGNKPRSEKTHFFDRFNSFDKVEKINVPVLICHGGRDRVVPWEHGVELHEKLKKPVSPLIVHGADHQTILNGAYPQTFCRIHRFLNTQTEVDLSSEETSDDPNTT
ncbi:phospholipase/carboxylesterase [Dictyocaulus viviparus]|uniref:Phospholipase/carboxylesterase n=1 Tax=Dictyocaulus viviparus TaxID=29172 RepID=A0A0D8XSD5_DICVI|nr:phospholipase/carboxylesterase [Dictyocaulus viviparus]